MHNCVDLQSGRRCWPQERLELIHSGSKEWGLNFYAQKSESINDFSWCHVRVWAQITALLGDRASKRAQGCRGIACSGQNLNVGWQHKLCVCVHLYGVGVAYLHINRFHPTLSLCANKQCHIKIKTLKHLIRKGRFSPFHLKKYKCKYHRKALKVQLNKYSVDTINLNKPCKWSRKSRSFVLPEFGEPHPFYIELERPLIGSIGSILGWWPWQGHQNGCARHQQCRRAKGPSAGLGGKQMWKATCCPPIDWSESTQEAPLDNSWR